MNGMVEIIDQELAKWADDPGGTALATAGSSIADATTTPPEDTSTGASESSAPADAGPFPVTPLEITLTDTSVEGLPEDLTAGVIDVTVTDETEASGGAVNFNLVEPGTTSRRSRPIWSNRSSPADQSPTTS